CRLEDQPNPGRPRLWCQTDGSPRHSRRASSGSKENWSVDVLISRRDVKKDACSKRRLRRRECV
ncbi:hypothetical protein AVEN_62541-1, partial [Araneus ventricosus]